MSDFKIEFNSNTAETSVANLIQQVEMLGSKLDAVNAKSLAPKTTQASATSAASLKKEMAEILSASNIRQAQLLGHQFEAVNRAVLSTNDSTGRLVEALRKNKAATKGTAESQKSFVDSLHSGRQATAAWRAGLNAAGASLGIFTSSTIITATAVYGLVAAYKQSIVAGVQFTDMMARVQAVTSASADEAERMSTHARAVAASTIFTARESADAMLQLGMSGMTVEQSMVALEPTLRLASIGMMTAGEAADIATNTMNQFGLSASQITQVVDDLATAANNANTTVSQVGNALSYVGPAAAAANVPIETAIASIQVLANAGIKASRAGTGLRRVISNFSGPTKKTADTLWALGIATKDAAGNLRPLEEILKDLAKANIGVAQATDLVGVRQQAALLALVKSARGLEDGSTSLENFKKELKNNGGAAKDFQKTIEDTLGADFKLLMSAAEEQAIAFFETNEAGYRSLTQSTTAFVRGLDVGTIKAFTDGVWEVGKGGAALLAATMVWKLVKSVESLSVVQKSYSLISVGATAATIGHTTATTGATVATTIFTAATAKLNLALKASWALMRAHPLAVVATAAAGLYLAYKMFGEEADSTTKTFKDHKEAAEGMGSAYAKAAESLERLNTIRFKEERVASKKFDENLATVFPGSAAPKDDVRIKAEQELFILTDKRSRLVSEMARASNNVDNARSAARIKEIIAELENMKKQEEVVRHLLSNELTGDDGKITTTQELSVGNLNEKSRQKWADWLAAEMKKSSSDLVANAREVANTLIEKTDEAEARGSLTATAAHKKRLMLLDETRRKIETIYSGESGSITTLESQIKAQEDKIKGFEDKNSQVEDFQYKELAELQKKLGEEQLKREKDLQEETTKRQKATTDYISSYIKGMQQIEKTAKSAYLTASNSASKLAEKNQVILASNRDLAAVGFVTAQTRAMENRAEIEAIRVKADLTDVQRRKLETTIAEVAGDKDALKARKDAIAALKQEADGYRRLADAKESQPVAITEARQGVKFSGSGTDMVAINLSPFDLIDRKYDQLIDKENEYYGSQTKNLEGSASNFKMFDAAMSKTSDQHKAMMAKFKSDKMLDQVGAVAELGQQMMAPWQQYFSNIQNAHQEHNAILVQQRKELVDEMKEVEQQDYTAQIVRMRELGSTRTEIAESIKATEEKRAQTLSGQKAEMSALDQQIDAQHKAFESAKSYSVAMAKLQIPLVFAQALAAPPGPPWSIPIAVGAAALAGQQVAQISGTSLPRRQFGGSVQKGKPTITNEAGPELFVPDKSGTIIPSDKLYRALQMAQTETAGSANSGGDTYFVELNVNAMDSQSILAHKDTITDMVVAGIDKKRRSRGKGTVIGV